MYDYIEAVELQCQGQARVTDGVSARRKNILEAVARVVDFSTASSPQTMRGTRILYQQGRLNLKNEKYQNTAPGRTLRSRYAGRIPARTAAPVQVRERRARLARSQPVLLQQQS
jgi:hypothetical protein